MKEAAYYRPVADKSVKCLLCPCGCIIKPDKTGRCLVRKNINERLFALTYAKVSSIANDPIEKKPLYHFYPGSHILSLGSYGCNLACGFCQNWSISQIKSPTQILSPTQAVELAKKNDSIGIAYTYNEPFIWYEYVLDTAKLVHQAGLKNVLVTNGQVNEEPLLELLPYIDAMNIDLKSINDSFYRNYCLGKLEPVKQCIQSAYKKCHIELTNLVIPQHNDSGEDINGLIDWAAGLSADIPLHFSRYFPQHKFTAPPTSVNTLQKAYNAARKKLKFVYLGNISGGEYGDTKCPYCNHTVIERRGYYIIKKLSALGKCSNCGKLLPIVMG